MANVSQRIAEIIDKRGALFLDGGLATELERAGFDLNHPLWSAYILMTRPEAIRQVHLQYLEAGSDCIVSCSYQASIPGFTRAGLVEQQARRLLSESVRLAREARDAFMSLHPRRQTQPLIGASIGPYGAYLADGSEFRGKYGISKGQLRDFHLPRWEILHHANPDLMACETIPNRTEAEVLRELFLQSGLAVGWVSFSCRDGRLISDGTPIREAAAIFEDVPGVFAIGVNCTAPRYISSLIPEIRMGAPSKRVAVYPNSGETWDAGTRSWTGHSDPVDFARAALEWSALGASVLGGCCRTQPRHIRAIRKAVAGSFSKKRIHPQEH